LDVNDHRKETTVSENAGAGPESLYWGVHRREFADILSAIVETFGKAIQSSESVKHNMLSVIVESLDHDRRCEDISEETVATVATTLYISVKSISTLFCTFLLLIIFPGIRRIIALKNVKQETCILHLIPICDQDGLYVKRETVATHLRRETVLAANIEDGLGPVLQSVATRVVPPQVPG
jgi:hypothetical protein